MNSELCDGVAEVESLRLDVEMKAERIELLESLLKTVFAMRGEDVFIQEIIEEAGL